MKFLKQIIAVIFLVGTIWLGYLVFSNEFSKPVIVYELDYELEDTTVNTFTKLIRSTAFTGLGVLFMGLLALFTNFVFAKLLFTDDIKNSAIKYLKQKRKVINKLGEKVKEPDNITDDGDAEEE